MILFVTGTHETCFARLVEAAERTALAMAPEEVVAQVGSCATTLHHARGVPFLAAHDIAALIRRARIVVTHGGPGTIREVLEVGKVPVVVPRDPALGEHVDDHQVFYAAHLERLGRAVLCDPSDLERFLQGFIPRAAPPLPDLSANRRRLVEALDVLLDPT